MRTEHQGIDHSSIKKKTCRILETVCAIHYASRIESMHVSEFSTVLTLNIQSIGGGVVGPLTMEFALW